MHKTYIGDARLMRETVEESIDIVVTSPPYPMIEMWDGCFLKQDAAIGEVLGGSPDAAFELMHRQLDRVWQRCYDLLKEGGFLCVNIGDATRTVNGKFKLYNNHTRITDFCNSIGFTTLPNIIWRKQTNAPNKFMGSGMLPCGAYVTLDPFLGTGTTMRAALMCGRNSEGYEIDGTLKGLIEDNFSTMDADACNDYIRKRFRPPRLFYRRADKIR